MVAFQNIQDTIKRIENNIAEPLDIPTLATAAHLSPYYFQRLFTRLVGLPIAEYQKQRRLARSLELLLNGDKRILDIALDLGFTNHDTFTRAFKAAFGLTPADARKLDNRQPGGFTYVHMPDVTMRYTLIDENVPLVTEGLVLEISRRVYTEERLFAGVQVNCSPGLTNSSNPGIAWSYWDTTSWNALPYLHPHGCHAGKPASRSDGQKGFSYLAGAQVTQRDKTFEQSRNWPGLPTLPDYLVYGYMNLPPGEYLVCTFTAEDFGELVEDSFQKAHRYLHGTFIKEHGLQPDSSTIDIYDKRSLRWHPHQRLHDDLPHIALCEPKLSQWEGPEMELQVKIK